MSFMKDWKDQEGYLVLHSSKWHRKVVFHSPFIIPSMRPEYAPSATRLGFQGLVDGNIKKLSLLDVSLIIQQGGTIIGTARCAAFRTREGRLKAAKNLIGRKITKLICCGGDGSLTGASKFKNEWSSLLEELYEKKEISKESLDSCQDLNLVGLVGSIDNDFCKVYKGDLTIGTDTALHRIVECVDSVLSTAQSHQRAFVLEVMGRECGYLAWGASVACGADYVIIPESPPVDGWEDFLCRKFELRRKLGRRVNLVIIAEGATDVHGNPITTNYVVDVIRNNLGYDTRSTILGHVQRGGRPSGYDRFMATITATEAVKHVLRASCKEPAQIVGLCGTHVVFCPLIESVAETQKVSELRVEKKYEDAMKQRGETFRRDYEYCIAVNRSTPKKRPPNFGEDKCIAIICVGAPAAGMNSAVRAAVRLSLNLGYTTYGVQMGFCGFENDELLKLDFMSVDNWGLLGGAQLGTNRVRPKNFQKIAETIKNRKIVSLLVVGGFEALTSVWDIKAQQGNRPELKIPIVIVPATISNNVPGTEWSIGCDTAVNAVVDAIDRLKYSADALRKRLFFVETQGANCGYLAFVSALSSGAETVYLQEKEVSLSLLTKDLDFVHRRATEGTMQQMVFVRSEECNPVYDIDFMAKLFEEEGKTAFSVRKLVLGHLCQGLHPSPLDRIRALQLSVAAINFLDEQIAHNKCETTLVGFLDNKIRFVNVSDLQKECVLEKRKPKKHWFTEYTDLLEELRCFNCEGLEES
ncbi:ATP-dependent 6-phosphofructokinase, platelet type-like [Zophobas morio]|uniref:ATP-dependent 6-phosphofructokinase, platelet type-like n=1 Tax=Zophobas morio TaxID=2755281 RepID=UPI0030839F3E